MTSTLPLTPDQLYDLATRTDKVTFKRIVTILYHNHRNHIDAGQVAVKVLRELDTRGAVSRDTLVMEYRKLVNDNQRFTTQIAQLRAQMQDAHTSASQTAPEASDEIDLTRMTQAELQAFLKSPSVQFQVRK